MIIPGTGSKLKLLALILVFFGPLFLAMMLYFNPHWFTLPGGRSHGELITPAQPLAALEAVSGKGQALPSDLLIGKWTLLYWNGGDCNLRCEADLFKMRQVRLSLGKNVKRAQTVYLTSEPTIDNHLERLLYRHPQLLTAHLRPENAFAGQISAYPKNSIYLVDPLGNLMMRYSNSAMSKGILRDLEKLLRVSGIG